MEEPSVLIVEDSPVHQRLLMEAFKRIGYTTRFDIHSDASGAWAAIGNMLRSPSPTWPRFAVVDIGLPGMSGIDLLDRIRHEAGLASWPVVILTASTNPDDATEVRMAEANGQFQKPATGGYEPVVRQMLDHLGSRVGWDARPRHQIPSIDAPRTKTPRKD